MAAGLMYARREALPIAFRYRMNPRVSSDAEPASEPAQKRAGFQWLRLFFVPFLLAGLAVLWFMTLGPLWQCLMARSWVPTPCSILESEVERVSGSDSDTFRVKVLYRYEFAGESYTSRRFDFSTGSSSSYKWKARVVADLPPDRQTVCFVNPRHPQEAVLERTPRAEIWFGLFGLPFIAVGCMAFARSGSPVARARRRAAKMAEVPEPAEESQAGWRVLKPLTRRSTKALFTMVFALVWNGLVWTFVLVMLHEKHRPPWGLLAFMSIFVIVGLLIAALALHQLLALFNPTLRVSIENGPLRLGGRRTLAWELHGATRRIRTLTVTLEGAEEATYSRGTTTTTERRVFTKEELFTNHDPLAMASGTAELRVPADSMHTFSGGRNAIVWRVRFHGDIPRFPDIDDEYALTVEPLALPAST
jgi:hypothetical protein